MKIDKCKYAFWRRRQSAKRGFTLVEIMIVLVMLVVLGAGIMVMLITGQSSFFTTEASATMQFELRRSMDEMVKELRSGGQFTTTTGSSNSVEFQIALGYNLGGSCPASDVCWGAADKSDPIQANWVNQPGWRIRYRLDTLVSENPQLIREVLDSAGSVVAGTSRAIANYVDTTPGIANIFTWDTSGNAKQVTISLAIRHTDPLTPGGTRTLGPITSRVELRNR